MILVIFACFSVNVVDFSGVSPENLQFSQTPLGMLEGSCEFFGGR